MLNVGNNLVRFIRSWFIIMSCLPCNIKQIRWNKKTKVINTTTGAERQVTYRPLKHKFFGKNAVSNFHFKMTLQSKRLCLWNSAHKLLRVSRYYTIYSEQTDFNPLTAPGEQWNEPRSDSKVGQTCPEFFWTRIFWNIDQIQA